MLTAWLAVSVWWKLREANSYSQMHIFAGSMSKNLTNLIDVAVY